MFILAFRYFDAYNPKRWALSAIGVVFIIAACISLYKWPYVNRVQAFVTDCEANNVSNLTVIHHGDTFIGNSWIVKNVQEALCRSERVWIPTHFSTEDKWKIIYYGQNGDNETVNVLDCGNGETRLVLTIQGLFIPMYKTTELKPIFDSLSPSWAK
jgi:hypothetical protein